MEHPGPATQNRAPRRFLNRVRWFDSSRGQTCRRKPQHDLVFGSAGPHGGRTVGETVAVTIAVLHPGEMGAGLYAGTTVDARLVSETLGAASALKTGFAAWTKGTSAQAPT
jgi:hypothetical protein